MLTSASASASHLSSDVLMILLSGFSLSQNELHLLLPGLGVVSAELLPHLDVALGLPDLVVELGVVEGQSNVGPELSYQRLVLLSKSEGRDLHFSRLPG